MVNTTVELGAFTGLTLDDPVLGLLDENPLDGAIAFTEIDEGVYNVQTRRGRARDLDRTSAGTVSVALRNETRLFDPRNPASRFHRFIEPRKPVRVKADGELIFTGFIDAWDFTYEPGGRSTATLVASDAFSIFARNENEDLTVPEELTGARLNRILDQPSVNFPADERDIQDGNSTLAAGVATGNVLSYIDGPIETSEQGLVFMTKDGKVALRERLIPAVASALQFRDDGTGVDYQQVQITFGTELLVNEAVVEFPGGVAVASDETSRVRFQTTTRRIETELSNQDQAQSIADFLISRYSDPEFRVQEITVDLRDPGAATPADLLALELGDQADILFRPNNIGPEIVIRNRIIGIAHRVNPADHKIIFNFEELPFEFFVLDDAQFGRLDDEASVLGF